VTEPVKPAQLDFYTFILGLGSSAFVHLGDAPHPETGKAAPPDLVLAQQTIDVLVCCAPPRERLSTVPIA
jgi:hypothetical protein